MELLAIGILTFSLKNKKSHCVALFNWMADLPVQNPKFLKEPFREALRKSNDICIFSFKVKFILFGVVIISVIIIQPALEYFIRNESYFVPLRSEIPFLPKGNIFVYLINMFQQSYVILTLFFTILMYNNFTSAVLICVIFYLDAIKLLMSNMTQGIKEIGFNLWLKTVATEVRNVKV